MITTMTNAWNTNAARQLIAVVIRPPINGPAAAPTPPIPVITPKALARDVVSVKSKRREDVDGRDQQGGADTFEDRVAEDQDAESRRSRADQRADPVDGEADREATLAAPPVGQLPAGNHQGGHHEQEDGDRDLDPLHGGVQVLADVGEHHVHVRAREAADELRESERNENLAQRGRRLGSADALSHGHSLLAKSFVEPEDVRSRGEVLDAAHQLVAVLLIEGSRLEVVGEVDGLLAPASRRFGFGGRDEPGREAATSETGRDPEVLQLAAVAPGPAADAGNDRAGVAYEDCQVDFRRRGPSRRTPPAGSRLRGLRCQRDPGGPRRGTPPRPARQTSTICSSNVTSSKYDRNDRIFPSRKSATVTPANWTRRPVASRTASSPSTSGPV